MPQRGRAIQNGMSGGTWTRHHLPSCRIHSSLRSISTSPAMGSNVCPTRVTTTRLEFGIGETVTILGFSTATRRKRPASTANWLNDVVARNDGSYMLYMAAMSPACRADHHACTLRSRSAASGAGAATEQATIDDISNAHVINRPTDPLIAIIACKVRTSF